MAWVNISLEILPPGNKKIERLALELPDGTYSDNDNNGNLHIDR